MKKNWINHTLALFVFSLVGLPAFSQGLLIEKKDGSQIKVPYEEFDCMTVYEADQPDNEDSVLPERYGKQLLGYSMLDSVKVSPWGPDVYKSAYSFTYDDKGRVLKETYYEEDWENEGIYYKWHGNQIDFNDSYENGTFTIENGKLVSCVSNDGSKEHYLYDKNGQLLQYKSDSDDGNFLYEMTWENGRVVEMKETALDGQENGTYVYEYADDKVCQAYFPYMYYPFGYNEFRSVHPCFLGKLMNHLPSRIIYDGTKGSHIEMNITYECDAEGYVTKSRNHYVSKIHDDSEQKFLESEEVDYYFYNWK